MKAHSRLPAISLRTFLVIYLIATANVSLTAQTQPTSASNLNRDRGLIMLSEIKEVLKENYYDPNFRNMHLDTRFKTAEERIKQAASTPQVFGIIAQVLQELDDSHTFFVPPSIPYSIDYGWEMKVVGERVYVSRVNTGSDADLKGLKAGDEVLKAGGYVLGRRNLWTFQYLYRFLRPQTSIKVTVQSPGGQSRELDLLAKVTDRKKVTDLTDQTEYMNIVRKSQTYASENRDQFHEFSKDVLIWKMKDFDLNDLKVDDVFEKVRNFKTLILDLRSNHGGWESTIVRVLENLFDRDVKVADMKSRNGIKPLIAKTRGAKTFKGKLIVLIDSGSASASEVIARVIQLEKRGVVIGDQSAGLVMRSRRYSRQIGIDLVVFYGVSITHSDVIMSDGSSLERKGVIPDELVLPTSSDLAAGRDPVLSRAAILSGVDLDPEKAGALFTRKPKLE